MACCTPHCPVVAQRFSGRYLVVAHKKGPWDPLGIRCMLQPSRVGTRGANWNRISASLAEVTAPVPDPTARKAPNPFARFVEPVLRQIGPRAASASGRQTEQGVLQFFGRSFEDGASLLQFELDCPHTAASVFVQMLHGNIRSRVSRAAAALPLCRQSPRRRLR